jgi:hypothetical protein
VLDVERASIDAGIHALEGRTPEAVAGFRAALADWGAMGLPWDQALTAWTAVETLGTSVPEARAWGAAARAILEQLGAATIVAHLDRALGVDGTPQPDRPTPARATGESEIAERA